MQQDPYKVRVIYLTNYAILITAIPGQHPMDLKETLEIGEHICSVHGDQMGVARKVIKIYGAHITTRTHRRIFSKPGKI